MSERVSEDGSQSDKSKSRLEIAIKLVAQQLAADQTSQDITERRRAKRETATILLLVIAAVLTGISDKIFYDTMTDARETARIVHEDNTKALAQSAYATKQTNDRARATLVESSRAWVGPTDAHANAAPSPGKELSFAIQYQNTGKQPARGFFSSVDAILATEAEEKKGNIGTRISADMAKCFATKEGTNTQVVYPSTGSASMNLGYTLLANAVTDDFVSGEKYIIFQGCFTYGTMQQTHHSTWCYFFRNGKTDIAHLNVCQIGNNAD